MADSIHILGPQFSSFTRVVQYCCEEIGLAYSLGTEWQGQTYGLRTPELLGVNPFGKVPVLIHNGKLLFESQVICRYLDNQFNQGRLQPVDCWQRAQVEQWCSAIALYVDKAIVRDYILEFRFPKGEDGSVRRDKVEQAIPEVLRMVEILEQQLADKPYLLGDKFSLADIQLSPVLHYLSLAPQNTDLLRTNSPLRAYLARLLERAAAQKVFV